jgi:hypothetical protein
LRRDSSLPAAHEVGRFARKTTGLAPDDIGQRCLLVTRFRAELVPKQIALGQVLDDDGVLRHSGDPLLNKVRKASFRFSESIYPEPQEKRDYGDNGERIGRCHRDDGIYRSRMVDSARSLSLRLRTRLSDGQW